MCQTFHHLGCFRTARILLQIAYNFLRISVFIENCAQSRILLRVNTMASLLIAFCITAKELMNEK